MKAQRITVKEALGLIAVSSIVAATVVAPGIAVAYNQLAKDWRRYKRGEVGKLVKRLYKQELVRLTERDGKVLIELSEQGRKKLRQYDFYDIHLQKKIDGKLRMVLFDIPNDKRQVRDIFRTKLKELGFMQLQESVFISPTPLPAREQFNARAVICPCSQVES